jgi:hypothetical protein
MDILPASCRQCAAGFKYTITGVWAWIIEKGTQFNKREKNVH